MRDCRMEQESVMNYEVWLIVASIAIAIGAFIVAVVS